MYFRIGEAEKSGDEICYMINMSSVQADMLFYGDSGVALLEEWRNGYNDNAGRTVTVYRILTVVFSCNHFNMELPS